MHVEDGIVYDKWLVTESPLPLLVRLGGIATNVDGYGLRRSADSGEHEVRVRNNDGSFSWFPVEIVESA